MGGRGEGGIVMQKKDILLQISVPPAKSQW